MLSDPIIISLLALIGTVFTSILTAIVTYKTAKLKTTIDAVHTLVNSNMGAQLKISALALRRVAFITQNRDDEEAADAAENICREHKMKQSIVDIGKG